MSDPSTPHSMPRSTPQSATLNSVSRSSASSDLAITKTPSVTPSSRSREYREVPTKSSFKGRLFGTRARKSSGLKDDVSPLGKFDLSTTPSTSLLSAFKTPFNSAFRTPEHGSGQSRRSVTSIPSFDEESDISLVLTPTVSKRYTRIAPESSVVRPLNAKHEPKPSGLMLTEEEQMLKEHNLFTDPLLIAITRGIPNSMQVPIDSSIKSKIGAYVVHTCHKVAVNSSNGTPESIQEWKAWLAAYVMGQYNTSKIPVQPTSGPDFAYLPGLPRSDEAMRLTRTARQCDFTLSAKKEKRASRICNELIDRFGSEMCAISRFDMSNEIVLAEVGWNNVGPVVKWTSIATHALMSMQTMIIHDATKDWRFAKNPHVQGSPSVTFYAGAPIMTSEGDIVGVVSVSSKQAREEFSFQQEKMLRSYADRAMVELFSKDDVRDSVPSSPVQHSVMDHNHNRTSQSFHQDLLVPRHRQRFKGEVAFDKSLIPPALSIRKTSQGEEIPICTPLGEGERYVNVNRQSWNNLSDLLKDTSPPTSSCGQYSDLEDPLLLSPVIGRPLPDIAVYRKASEPNGLTQRVEHFSDGPLEDVFAQLDTIRQRRDLTKFRDFHYSGKGWVDRHQDENSVYSRTTTTDDEAEALLQDNLNAQPEADTPKVLRSSLIDATMPRNANCSSDDDPLLQCEGSWTNFDTASGMFETIRKEDLIAEAMAYSSGSSDVKDSPIPQSETTTFDEEMQRLAMRNSMISTTSSYMSETSITESALDKGTEIAFASEMWARWLKCDVIYIISLRPVRDNFYRGELEIPGNMQIDMLSSFGGEKLVQVKILLDALTHTTAIYDNWHGDGDYGCGYIARVDAGDKDDRGTLFCAFRAITIDGTRPSRWTIKEADLLERATECLRTTMKPTVKQKQIERIFAKQTSIAAPSSLHGQPCGRVLNNTIFSQSEIDLPKSERKILSSIRNS